MVIVAWDIGVILGDGAAIRTFTAKHLHDVKTRGSLRNGAPVLPHLINQNRVPCNQPGTALADQVRDPPTTPSGDQFVVVDEAADVLVSVSGELGGRRLAFEPCRVDGVVDSGAS